MGGSRRGNFGNTNGSRSFLDRLSDILTAASLIPGLDTITDLAAIPVDLLRGDLESALLDVLGVLPLAGEIADTAKIINKADDAVDAIKIMDKVKDTYTKVVSNLPKNPNTLIERGWKESTPEKMAQNTSSKIFTHEKSGLQIRFDKGEKNATGFKGKDHYHILNPNSTGKHDHYLDINGNPVAKNSKASHIIP